MKNNLLTLGAISSFIFALYIAYREIEFQSAQNNIFQNLDDAKSKSLIMTIIAVVILLSLGVILLKGRTGTNLKLNFLNLNKNDRLIFGVCHNLSRKFDIKVILVRVVFLISLVLLQLIALLIYIILALISYFMGKKGVQKIN